MELIDPSYLPARRMSLGMIKDFDAPEAPDSPTASTTSGSLMAARVSQSATKKCRRVGQNSVENLGRKSVGSFNLFYYVLLFAIFVGFCGKLFCHGIHRHVAEILCVLLTISEHL